VSDRQYAPGEIDSVGKIATAINRAERLLVAILPTPQRCARSPCRRSMTWIHHAARRGVWMATPGNSAYLQDIMRHIWDRRLS